MFFPLLYCCCKDKELLKLESPRKMNRLIHLLHLKLKLTLIQQMIQSLLLSAHDQDLSPSQSRLVLKLQHFLVNEIRQVVCNWLTRKNLEMYGSSDWNQIAQRTFLIACETQKTRKRTQIQCIKSDWNASRQWCNLQPRKHVLSRCRHVALSQKWVSPYSDSLFLFQSFRLELKDPLNPRR